MVEICYFVPICSNWRYCSYVYCVYWGIWHRVWAELRAFCREILGRSDRDVVFHTYAAHLQSFSIVSFVFLAQHVQLSDSRQKSKTWNFSTAGLEREGLPREKAKRSKAVQITRIFRDAEPLIR